MNDFTNHYTSDDDQDIIDEFEHFEPLGNGIGVVPVD